MSKQKLDSIHVFHASLWNIGLRLCDVMELVTLWLSATFNPYKSNCDILAAYLFMVLEV